MNACEWLAVGLVLALLAGILPLVRAVSLRCGASAEVARKSVHVALGLACMGFPWMFDRPEPVWVLACIASLALLLVRSLPSLRAGIGSALHGVRRLSFGEVLFAPAVALVFQLSGGDPFLFGIPVAVLALADAAGALGGTRWGRHHYAAGEGFKTVEGSMWFFLTAVACVMPPLWLGGAVDFWPALWTGLIVGLLATMAEGLADRGFDNLVVPVGSFFVLHRLVELDAGALAWRFAVAVFFLILVVAGSKWSTLSGGALLGCALLGYGCAVMADMRFMLPPLAVFVCHLWVTRGHFLAGAFDHRLDAVLSHAIGCLPWVIAVERGVLEPDVGLAGVSFAMATQLAMMKMATHWWLWGGPAGLAGTLARSWACAALPGLLWLWADVRILLLPAGFALAASFLCVRATRNLRPQEARHATLMWVLQGFAALLCSLPALIYVP